MPPGKPRSKRYDAQKRETYLRNLVNTTGNAADQALAKGSFQGAAALLRLSSQARQDLDALQSAEDAAAPVTPEQVLEHARELAPEMALPILEVFAAEFFRRTRTRPVPESA